MIWFIPCSYKIYTAETFVWLLSSLEPRPCLCPRPSSGMMETCCKSLAVICYFLMHSYDMSMVKASTVVHLWSSFSILKNFNFSWKAQQNPKSSRQPSHYATQVGTCAEHSSIFGTFRPSNRQEKVKVLGWSEANDFEDSGLQEVPTLPGDKPHSQLLAFF